MLRPLYLAWQKGALETVPLWSFVPVGVAVSLVAALATYYLFEKPVTRWLSGRRKSRASAPVPAPA
jgi:peptidoglycan/LPS O-acetylase OafA/YrhL